jgi:methyl-accepting chemotaxis protein
MTLLIKIVLVSLLVLTSCASLTKTQVASVHKYAQLLETNADYPGIIIKEYISIEYDIQKLNTGTFSALEVNAKMWNSFKGKSNALKAANKADLGMKIIDEYASALNKLSSKELYEDISGSSGKLGTNIDSLINKFNSINDRAIPLGTGKLITKTLTQFGQGYVKNKQANELKQYILEGDLLVSVTTSCIQNNLDSLILRQWIPGLITDLKIRQENLLQNLNPKGDYTAYYATEFNKEVAILIGRIGQLEQLTKQTIASVNKLGKAHKELLENIKERKKIKEVLKETQDLFVSTRQILESYKSLTEIKTVLPE